MNAIDSIRWRSVVIAIAAVLCASSVHTPRGAPRCELHIGGSSPEQRVSRNGAWLSARLISSRELLIGDRDALLEMEARVDPHGSSGEQERRQRLMEARLALDQRRQQYDRFHFFALRIGYEDPTKDIVYAREKQGSGDYRSWLARLLFGLDRFIFIEDASSREVAPSQYHLERRFGLQPYRSILLQFPRELGERFSLRVGEFGLGVGRVHFDFDLGDGHGSCAVGGLAATAPSVGES